MSQADARPAGPMIPVARVRDLLELLERMPRDAVITVSDHYYAHTWRRLGALSAIYSHDDTGERVELDLSACPRSSLLS